MMGKFSIFYCLIVILLCIACSNASSLVTPTIWKNLDIYLGGDAKDGVSELDKLLKDKNNRIEVINFVKEELTAYMISHKDQIKLALIFRRLKEHVTKDEYGEVCSLINLGINHHDYYGMVLSVEPPYLFDSIGVFKSDRDLFANFANPDGGMIKYNIKNNFLSRLKKATKQDFGSSYLKWRTWWLEKGNRLIFDDTKKIYINK